MQSVWMYSKVSVSSYAHVDFAYPQRRTSTLEEEMRIQATHKNYLVLSNTNEPKRVFRKPINHTDDAQTPSSIKPLEPLLAHETKSLYVSKVAD